MATAAKKSRLMKDTAAVACNWRDDIDMRLTRRAVDCQHGAL